MNSRSATAPNPTRTDLAHALGFNDTDILKATPYLNYIENRRRAHHGTTEEYRSTFIRILQHFSSTHAGPRTIRTLLDSLMAEKMVDNTNAGSEEREKIAKFTEDTVMHIMGVWSMLSISFMKRPSGKRRITTAYSVRARPGRGEAYDQNLAGLICGSGLLSATENSPPTLYSDHDGDIVRTATRLVALLNQSDGAIGNNTSSQILSSSGVLTNDTLEAMDALESLSIAPTRLNAFTLYALGAVEIYWTYDVSRHMMLSYHEGHEVFELFALPIVLKAGRSASDAATISPALTHEIQETYATLFNAWPKEKRPFHAKYGSYFGFHKICWCWSCSARRYRDQVVSKYRKLAEMPRDRMTTPRPDDPLSEYDPYLVELMGLKALAWSPDANPYLWPRIQKLEKHLQLTKPWSIRMLLQDRRDTLQFWTFL